MGRITFGDVAIAGVLTLFIVLAIIGATAFVLYMALGLSADDYFVALIITVSAFFLGGGILLGTLGRRAGYPILSTWAWGAMVIIGIHVVLAVGGGLAVSVDVIPWLVLMASVLLLGLLFVVGLAGFLNARYFGMPVQRTFGTRPGAWGASIYKSNQPAIYEGIRALDFDDKAPGSLYRQRR